jgi:hypothetical protein
MSARDAGAAWDLRCEIREQLLAYLQRHHPTALPRLRAQLDGDEAVVARASAPGRPT